MDPYAHQHHHQQQQGYYGQQQASRPQQQPAYGGGYPPQQQQQQQYQQQQAPSAYASYPPQPQAAYPPQQQPLYQQQQPQQQQYAPLQQQPQQPQQPQQQAYQPAQLQQQEVSQQASLPPALPAKMTPGPGGDVSLDTQHEDMVHDAQLDYYGKKLATCSSDRTIKQHVGPVWEIAWAHPRWGSLLASASYDGMVLIHRENKDKGTWDTGIVHQGVENQSVNSIAFERVWRLATGSCDNEVRVWTGGPSKRTEAEWVCDILQDGHKDWVRDVAWAPPTGLTALMLASAGEDGKVFIWTQAPGSNHWKKATVALQQASGTAPSPVWRVSWSLTGNVLAVSSGDQHVALYKQRLNGEWAAWEETLGGGEGWKKVDSAAGPPPTATGNASPALPSS
ncbi:sec13-related protein [Nannochloropsis oceanica]